MTPGGIGSIPGAAIKGIRLGKTEADDEKKPWYKRPPIIAAMITGTCAIIAAIIVSVVKLLGGN